MVRFGAKKEEFIPPFLFYTNKKRGLMQPSLCLVVYIFPIGEVHKA